MATPGDFYQASFSNKPVNGNLWSFWFVAEETCAEIATEASEFFNVQTADDAMEERSESAASSARVPSPGRRLSYIECTLS